MAKKIFPIKRLDYFLRNLFVRSKTMHAKHTFSLLLGLAPDFPHFTFHSTLTHKLL